MKRLLAAVMICGILLSTLAACGGASSAGETSFSLADPAVLSKVNIEGRYALVSDGVTMDWSCSAVEFTAVCSGDVYFDLSWTTKVRSRDENQTNGYFSVYVDDVLQPRYALTGNVIGQETAASIPVATGLKSGEHHFRVIRQTEAMFANATAKAIRLTGELKKTSARERLIEFVGDSITVGMGNLSSYSIISDAAESKYAAYQDGTQGYAFLAAEALGTDWSILAQSGIAAYYGYGTAYSGSWSQLYPYTSPFRSMTETWTPRRQADVVCIALGTNDIWGGMTFTQDELAERMAELMRQTRTMNPASQTVWIVGGIMNGYAEAAQKAILSLGGESAGYYYCAVSSGLNAGCGHPSADQHRTMANELAQFFRDKKLLEKSHTPTPSPMLDYRDFYRDYLMEFDNDTCDYWFYKEQETYHAFFLEFVGTGEARHQNIAHATSTDFLNWEYQGAVLKGNGDGWETGDLATGSVVKMGDTFYMLYTAHSSPGYGLALAESSDLYSWERIGTTSVIPGGSVFKASYQGVEHTCLPLADPYIYPEPIDGWYYAYVNSWATDRAKNARGCQLMLRTQDMVNWEPYKIAALTDDLDRLETAQVWEHNGKWYMSFGGRRVDPAGGDFDDVESDNYIYMADSFDGPFLKQPWSRVNYPTECYHYIQKVVTDPYGDEVMLAMGPYKGVLWPFSMVYGEAGALSFHSIRRTVIEDNGAATLSGKWSAPADGSVRLSLDTTDALAGGNALKATIDRSKNDYSIGNVYYNYETAVTGADGISFRASSATPMTLRVAVVMDWSKQRYADITVDAVPRTYTIRWADTGDYGLPFSADGAGFFTQIVFQYGRQSGDPIENTLYLDELVYFSGGEQTDLSGTPLRSAYTLIEDNEAATLNGKWATQDASVSLTLDTSGANGVGNCVKAAIDASENEYGVATVRYDYLTAVAGSDGIRLVLCAEKKLTLRVAVVMDWTKQRYIDLSVDTVPRRYTMRWEDCGNYGEPFAVTGGGYFTQIVLQSGREATDPVKNTLYIDELDYFSGNDLTDRLGAALGAEDDPLLPQDGRDDVGFAAETPMTDNEGGALEQKWVGSADGAAIITLDKTDRMTTGNSAAIAVDSSKNEYGIATFRYDCSVNVTATDGIRLTAFAEKDTTLRVAVVMDWAKQRYYDLPLTSTPRTFTVRWEDCGDYGDPFAETGGGYLTQVVFQIGRNVFDPTCNTVYIDDLTYFTGTMQTNPIGSRPVPNVVLGDLSADGSVNSDDLTALARHVAKIDEISYWKYSRAADVNGDDRVDSDDLTKMAKYIAKIIDTLDSEKISTADIPVGTQTEFLGKKWEVTFSDDFNGDRLNPDNWTDAPAYLRGDFGNNYWDSSQISVKDGCLTLGIDYDAENDKILSGAVESKYLFEQTRGYFECRAKLQKASGCWSAFWLMTDEMVKVGNGGTDGAEIDIFESPFPHDDTVQLTLHWDGYGEDHQSAGNLYHHEGLYDGFHVFALEWNEDEYIYYVDGVEAWRTNAGGVCAVPCYMLLSVEAGTWGGAFLPEQMPDGLTVDYVRVYREVK